MTALAELRQVRKAFGQIDAVAGVDLHIEAGEVLAVLGPNGAGKSTVVRLLLGLRRPDSGTARLFERDPREPAARRRCGATPQETGLPETLRVREILEFARAHFPAPLALDELLSRFSLTELAARQAGGLSGGERRRVAVALAFAGDPELVFLDEPSSGLDVAARHGLWDVIRSFAARGRSILLTTHDLREAEGLATRVIVLDRGRVVASGSPAVLARQLGGVVVRLRRQRLPSLHNAEATVIDGDRLAITTRDEASLLRELVALHADLAGIEIARPGLEHLLLTGDQ
jgi:ABC-2 type transport system ATP-binding protein